MRKSTWIFSLLLIFTLLLSACAGGDDQGASGTIVPGAGETQAGGIPDTGVATEGAGTDMAPTQGAETTEAVTEEASPTGEATGEGTATEEATEAATEAATEESTPTTGAGGTGKTTPTADSATTPRATSQAGSGQGAGAGVIGIPETGSGGLVGLAAMMDWTVEGADGSEIGTVQDYVVNMCEAHILYLVVDPAAEVGVEDGQQLLIPFEAVLGELNEGSSVNVQERVFTLKQNAADLSGVPGVDIATADLENPEWSEDVLDFWSTDYRLSMTAGCNVPVSGTGNQSGAGGTGQQATTETPAAGTETAGTPAAGTPAAGTPAASTPAAGTPAAGETAVPTAAVTNMVEGTPSADRQTVYRLALASEVLTADLQEGNGRLLGTVQDIAIVPESGRTQYIVVETGEEGQGAGRMVALPPGAVNVSYENGAGQPVLVLLVETNLLQNAPEFDENTTTTDDNWFNFWNQYIPMTREQLP